VYPPILLADEPTGNLDTRTGDETLALIRDLHRRLKSTVVIVTHDMSVAESCERTIALRDGRIVEDIRRNTARAPQDVRQGRRVGASGVTMILLRLISWSSFSKQTLRTRNSHATVALRYSF